MGHLIQKIPLIAPDAPLFENQHIFVNYALNTKKGNAIICPDNQADKRKQWVRPAFSIACAASRVCTLVLLS